MGKTPDTQQYVLLPLRGLRAESATTSPEAQQFLRSADEAIGSPAMSIADEGPPLRVLDSIGPTGAKLVEASPESALAVRALHPDLRLVPVVYYTPAVVVREEVREDLAMGVKRPTAEDTVTLHVVSKGGAPVGNAFVVAFVDYAAKKGVQGITGADGSVDLVLGASSMKLDRLYVYPLDANWSLVKKKVTIKTGDKVTVTPLDLGYQDGVRHFYGNAAESVGAGVTVGVVDTGIATHPDLVVAGGANTVDGENPKDFGDNGKGHGTHVAGIIAARGTPPNGIRGVAPGVTLRSYRAYGKGSGSASSFAIAKAIDTAVKDKCDLINLSVSGAMPDPTLKAAVDDARTKGSVCIVAAGNGDRAPIGYPAAEESAIAVSGCGRKGTFPTNSSGSDEVSAPYGTDKSDFLAAFSNVGPQMDLTGPGVGIMSTFPGGYAEISGTSMACPAAVGAAARAIAGTSVIKMKRDAKRSAAMVKAVLATAKPLGFGPNFEGHGLAQPK
ncbi:MAG: S8 family serine peptidase [Actinobacteria bacterium]|nr:S8 family serine peptidase [Actinomycetota bacterium]